MPQNSNFRLPRGHRFRPKSDLRVMAPNHGGDPLGSILGPMGSHWVKKMGQNRAPKKFSTTMPQNSNFRLPRGHRFRPKSHLTVMAPNHGGDPLGSILRPMGSQFSTTPRSSISAKYPPYGYGAKSRWGPPGVHLGANGVHWSKKWVKTLENYNAPKFEFSTTLRSSISAKIRP